MDEDLWEDHDVAANIGGWRGVAADKDYLEADG